ncbi:hypothetical protein D3C76_1702630 [compost metagenome]
MDTLQIRNEKIPADIPRATTTGTMFFSLAMAQQKENFQEALASYKESREKLFGSVPYLRFFSKTVALYASLRGPV